MGQSPNRDGDKAVHVLIAGGGVGGLVLAMSLHERGISCTVFEAAAEVRELGVGINMLPHAVRELAALGMLPALDAAAIRTREMRYLDRLGNVIWAEPRGLFAGHDVPQFSFHRGRLHGVLWRAASECLPPGTLQTGMRLVGFAQDVGGVTARFTSADGGAGEQRGDVLVGADGIHSALRAILHPNDGGIRWQGVQMWRGALDWPAFDDGDVMVIAGNARGKVVLYPIAPGEHPHTRLLNWVVYAPIADGSAPPPGRQDWSCNGRVEDILPHARHIRLPFIDVERVIRESPFAAEYPMCDRDPLPWWTQGRVTLLGDAAHPMYPVGSNGASQATLDARCLARLLDEMPAEAALVAYEAERLPKTAEIVGMNRLGGPERVIDFASARAPDGFRDIAQVASHEELAEIVAGYARTAGFAVRR